MTFPTPPACHLRQATTDDLPAIAALYNLAYPAPDFNADWIVQRFQNNERFAFPDSVIVAELDRQIVGMCVAMPLEIHTPGGGGVPMQGISTVAVSPVQRGRGIGGSLMRYCLRLAQAGNVPVVSCFPFEYRYYGRFGFTPVGRTTLHQFPPQVLPAFDEGLNVRLLSAEDIAEVGALHEGYHSGRDLISLRRSKQAWHTWWPWYRFQAVGYPATGPLEGFLLYDYKTITDHRLQHDAQVRDFVAVTPAAERGLFGYLARLADQVSLVTMAVPDGDPLPLLWTEQRLPTGKSMRRGDYATGETLIGLTLRISHVPTALVGRTYNGANGSLILAITDADLPENAGTWRLTFEDGVASVAVARGESADLTCDVSALAAIWSGAMPVSTAWRWGRIQLTDPAALPLLDDAFRTAGAPQVAEFDTF
jgi:predicted acetyltransferase